MLKSKLIIIQIAILFLILPCILFSKDLISKNIVKIYVVSSEYNYYTPWQMRSQSNSSGSGSIIAGQRILTNAHVISNQTYVEVKRAGMARRFIANVEFVSHESDLAILTVKDKNFFQGSYPLPIGELPKVQDPIKVYGFPAGGSELSITSGLVSRIEHRYYSHSKSYLLAAQIDAAINPGNSGGPVMQNGKIVGVAFQVYRGGQNIGYMVPVPVILHFLKDISDGKYDGIPSFGVSMQKMQNIDMRRKFGMKDNESGVLVRRIAYGSPAEDALKPGDILTAIDNTPIANNGTIEFRPDERTYFGYLLQNKQINETAKLSVIRNGQRFQKEIKLTVPLNQLELVPYDQYDKEPTYFIIGGFLFMPLNKNLMEEWGKNWYYKAPKNFLYNYYYKIRTQPTKEIVVLVKVLADEINAGYHDMANMIIKRVNGKPIYSMQDLIAAFEKNKGKYHEIMDQRNSLIILNRKKVALHSQRILKKYKVPADRSADLKQGK